MQRGWHDGKAHRGWEDAIFYHSHNAWPQAYRGSLTSSIRSIWGAAKWWGADESHDGGGGAGNDKEYAECGLGKEQNIDPRPIRVFSVFALISSGLGAEIKHLRM